MELNAKHFKRNEFACKCGCGFDTVDSALLGMLEKIRETFKAPVIILSGCRCHTHNASIGGADHSQHLYGRAADFYVKGVELDKIYNFIKYYLEGESYGLGKYKSFLHFDTRTTKDGKPDFWFGWHRPKEGEPVK